MKNTNTKQIPLSFSAVEPYWVENTIAPKESDISGQSFVQWGERNLYPTFIHDVYEESPTLKTIINSVVDYVIGDGVESEEFILTSEKLEDIVSTIAYSYSIYGGFALNVLRNRVGGIADVVVLDMRNLRSNKDKTVFYYSEDFGVKSYGRGKYIELPKFDPSANDASSIYFYSNQKWNTYPLPVWSACVKAAQIESKIGEYHLNNLSNGFSSNVMVCMNNGIPSDDVKEEIERGFTEKFCGVESAGNVVISYAVDKDHAATIEKIETENFADKYNSLYKWSREQLFLAFRTNPNLCGIATESNGFNSEEYNSSFKLFNRTVVRPIQKRICNAFDIIFGKQNVVTIKPFSFEEGEDSEVQ